MTPLRVAARLATFALALSLSVATTGCSDDGASLTVLVATGLVPGPEFTFVEVNIVDTGDVRTGVAIQRTTEARAIFGNAFARGKRVAEFQGLAPGEYVAVVTLLRTDGSPLIRRRVRVAIDSDFVLVVHLTRDCVGVMCPQPGGSAALTECLAGHCVDPRCNPPDPEFCPEVTFCLEDTDCPSTASCATARCVGGVCEEEMNDDACPLESYCDPTPMSGGCTVLPVSPDAGALDDASSDDLGVTPDAEVDAGVDMTLDGGPSFVCGTVCALDDMPCALGYWLCAPGTAPVCTDLGADREDGVPCGGDMVCIGGRCVACEPGAPCTEGCRAGVLDCSGSPACVVGEDLAPAGTRCGSDVDSVCDAAGECVTCEDGVTPCTEGCARGHLDSCATGGTCVLEASSFEPPGTFCDTDSVCEPDGTCAHCAEGEDCLTPNGCGIGSVAGCSAGVFCAFTYDYVAATTECPDGICNGEGACCSPASVEQYDFYYGTGCAVTSAGAIDCWTRFSPPAYGWVRSPTVEDFTQVSVGQYAGCGVRTDGSVYCFGMNYSGQLGDGTFGDNAAGVQALLPGPARMVAVAGDTACAALMTGDVYCWGYLYWDDTGVGTFATPIQVADVSDIVEVDVSYMHACMRSSTGSVYCLGGNSFGESGADPFVFGDPLYYASLVAGVDDAVDIAVTDNYSCALLSDGSIVCWGYQVETMGSSYEPVPQSALGFSDAVQVDAGSNAVCVRRPLPNGEMWCWGESRMLALGEDLFMPVGPTQIDGLGPIATMGLGASEYACATEADTHQLFCWGNNDGGQLGFDTASPSRYDVTPVCGPL